jgi:hypothetical protein
MIMILKTGYYRNCYLIFIAMGYFHWKRLANLVLVILVFCNPLESQPVKLGAVSDLSRVFEDGYSLPQMSDTLKIFGIRGEIISGQIAIRAEKNMTDVTVTPGEFKNRRDGCLLPPESIEWNFVGSVHLANNAPNQPAGVIVRKAPASFPDYLMAERKIDIKQKSWKAVWLTVSIPGNAEAGIYNGSVKVTGDMGEHSLAAVITVYPLSLPAERHLKVTEWYNTGNFRKFHGINEMYSDEWFSMLKKYAANMAEHRQNVFEVPANSIAISRSADGKFSFDFSRFDQIALVFWSTGKMDFLETGELTRFGGEGHWDSKEILFRDFPVMNTVTGSIETIPGKEVLPFFLPAFENHLRMKGWLSRTLFHIKDEPSLHNAVAWRDASSYIHRYAPDLRRIDAIETTFLSGFIEVAVPKLDHLGSWTDYFDQAAREGTEVWFYTVGIFQAGNYPNKTIDVPLMDSRIMHWLNYEFDLAGYLHWGWNQWNDDPFGDPGQHIGDGWHVYPTGSGVLNSLRWEEMRNGLQDYEYFWLLEKRIKNLRDSLGTNFSWIDPKQRGREIAGGIIRGLSSYNHDPEIFYRTKTDIVNDLLSFYDFPRLYVQTTPAVTKTLQNGSAVEVFGWTEPGTKITVNGEELPVSSQGLFMSNFSVSRKRNFISITASGSKGIREIKRSFNIE